jgi:hypothetical protein
MIGAYEWGGKSGIGVRDSIPDDQFDPLESSYGTKHGFGPVTRPMNAILYKGNFVDHLVTDSEEGMMEDTKLDLGLYQCPSDNGPPRGGHCPSWVEHYEPISSYDWFGNSYAANVFMTAPNAVGQPMSSNSPYMRPTTRVPTPARTLYYEENIGRWAWAMRNEWCDFLPPPGPDPGPTNAIRGWHGQDWWYNRAFVDAHAEYQQLIFPETRDENGWYYHYRSEKLTSYPPLEDGTPGTYTYYHCVIIRGDGWQKDTLPAAQVPTGLIHNQQGRPSYEGCIEQ